MWTYFGLAIAVLLIGVFSKNKDIYLFGRKFNLSRWLIGIVGFSYIVVVICAVVIMSIRINAIGGLSLLGKSYAAMGNLEASWVDARLLPGYYLACCVGPLLILIALLRNKIKGKLQTE
jgi:dolichyl-phosphate-mannose--protein O-mannosyl transferase